MAVSSSSSVSSRPMKVSVDFCAVNESVWKILRFHHGGGPALMKQTLQSPGYIFDSEQMMDVDDSSSVRDPNLTMQDPTMPKTAADISQRLPSSTNPMWKTSALFVDYCEGSERKWNQLDDRLKEAVGSLVASSIDDSVNE